MSVFFSNSWERSVISPVGCSVMESLLLANFAPEDPKLSPFTSEIEVPGPHSNHTVFHVIKANNQCRYRLPDWMPWSSKQCMLQPRGNMFSATMARSIGFFNHWCCRRTLFSRLRSSGELLHTCYLLMQGSTLFA